MNKFSYHLRNALFHCIVALAFCTMAGCSDDNLVNSQDSKPTPNSQPGPRNFFGELPIDDNFAQVQQSVPLRLPFDHKSHPNFQLEWWYFTFVLEGEHRETGQVQQLGLQYTLFRFNTNSKAKKTSHWSNSQQFMAHASLHSKTQHFFEERFATGSVGNAYVSNAPFQAVIDDWSVKSENATPFPSILQFSINPPLPNKSRSTSAGNSSAKALGTLHLTATQPFIKQGVDGYSKKTSDERLRSYYYSQPFIDAKGEIIIENEVFKVTGKGWYDHEWTSHLVARDAMGWDWFSLHLDNGSKLMAFRMHTLSSDANAAKNSVEMFTTGSFITANGKKVALEANDISITPVEYETIVLSDAEGSIEKQVPTHWQMLVPKANIAVNIRPFKQGQWNASVFPYYEGRIEIEGSHKGSGFLELTGY